MAPITVRSDQLPILVHGTSELTNFIHVKTNTELTVTEVYTPIKAPMRDQASIYRNWSSSHGLRSYGALSGANATFPPMSTRSHDYAKSHTDPCFLQTRRGCEQISFYDIQDVAKHATPMCTTADRERPPCDTRMRCIAYHTKGVSSKKPGLTNARTAL